MIQRKVKLEVNIERLLSYTDMLTIGFYWGCSCLTWHVDCPKCLITLESAKEILDEVSEVTTPYIEKEDAPWTSEQHIGRAKYFINNPHKITPISIENFCMDGQISDFVRLVDGNHRLLACMLMGRKTITAWFCIGRSDLLDYLTGKSDVKPEGWIDIESVEVA